MPELPQYRRPYWDTQPDYLVESYASTQKRSPSKPLIILPQTLSEVTGPVFGHDAVKPGDNDLTHQHAGEPIGERIYVSGRVLDENGRPVTNTLVELWQANAAGRYPHKNDNHDAPLDPNFSGAGRVVTEDAGSPHLGVASITGEVYFGHADNDGSMTPDQIKALESALDEAGVTYTSELYEGSPHGYTMTDTAMYHQPGEERHWAALFDLLDRTR